MTQARAGAMPWSMCSSHRPCAISCSLYCVEAACILWAAGSSLWPIPHTQGSRGNVRIGDPQIVQMESRYGSFLVQSLYNNNRETKDQYCCYYNMIQ